MTDPDLDPSHGIATLTLELDGKTITWALPDAVLLQASGEPVFRTRSDKMVATRDPALARLADHYLVTFQFRAYPSDETGGLAILQQETTT